MLCVIYSQSLSPNTETLACNPVSRFRFDGEEGEDDDEEDDDDDDAPAPKGKSASKSKTGEQPAECKQQ